MYEVVVAICCYKQKHWLHRCLRSLSVQTMNKDKYEVVVVNDDPTEFPTENMEELAKKAIKKFKSL